MRLLGRAEWLVVGVAAAATWAGLSLRPPAARDLPLTLNAEQRDGRGQAINPATQSVNRYASLLEEMTRVSSVRLSAFGTRMEMSLAGAAGRGEVRFRGVDYYQLVPVLPYPVAKAGPDDFDKANLMLSEFARNGLALSHQRHNTRVASFHDEPASLFGTNQEEDYSIRDGAVAPNPRARPKRFSIINNCLRAGLWELSAIDSVGEMYHAWLSFPAPLYYEMIRRANGLRLPDEELGRALEYRADLGGVVADLDRLREPGPLLFEGEASLVASKEIGAYSTQDSRQKSQQRYFEVSRAGAHRFDELLPGDTFSARRFVEPGVYSATERTVIGYDPSWRHVEIRSVTPRTRFRDGAEDAGARGGYVEVAIESRPQGRRVVVGNIPLSLLVEQEDYLVPAFGAGAPPPWELAERRLLRLAEGPPPHYGYLLARRGDSFRLENNHESGIEQVALRVLRRDDRLALRVTFVAYERIFDLLEVEVELSGPLVETLRAASAAYRPPLFRVYEDPNVI